MTKPRTLYDKIWDDHVAHEAEDGTCRLYIDRHLVHEVTSPQFSDAVSARYIFRSAGDGQTRADDGSTVGDFGR